MASGDLPPYRPSDPPEDLWRVDHTRRGALASFRDFVGYNCTAGDDLILLNPGCANDILHPLFAAYSRVTRFVFIDIESSCVNSLEMAFPAGQEKRRLNDLELKEVARGLNIDIVSAAASAGWSFPFQGRERLLVFVQSDILAFLNSNPAFSFHIYYEKDFWETDLVIPLDAIVPRLPVGGIYSKNSSGTDLGPFLSTLGLRELTRVNLNGSTYLWQKVNAVPPQTFEMIDQAKEAAGRAITMALYIDPNIEDLKRVARLTDSEWAQVFGLAHEVAASALTETLGLQGQDLGNAAQGIVSRQMKDLVDGSLIPTYVTEGRRLAERNEIPEDVLELLKEALKSRRGEPNRPTNG